MKRYWCCSTWQQYRPDLVLIWSQCLGELRSDYCSLAVCVYKNHHFQDCLNKIQKLRHTGALLKTANWFYILKIILTLQKKFTFENSLSQAEYSAIKKIPRVMCLLAGVILTVLKQKYFTYSFWNKTSYLKYSLLERKQTYFPVQGSA